MGKINVIALAIFLGLLVWVFSFSRSRTDGIQKGVLGMVTPFIKAGHAVEGAAKDLTRPERTVEELEEENTKLRQQNAELIIYKTEYQKLVAENSTIARALGLQQRTEMSLIPSRIIAMDNAGWSNTVVIDKGIREGVATASPVLTDVGLDAGLVGKTLSSTAGESTVLLLTDEQCKVAAYVQGTTARGLLSGKRGATRQNPELKLIYFPKEMKLEVGARVYSAEEGGLFPENILLGEIKGTKMLDVWGEATVTPAVDFANMKYVFVMERELGDFTSEEPEPTIVEPEPTMVEPEAEAN